MHTPFKIKTNTTVTLVIASLMWVLAPALQATASTVTPFNFTNTIQAFTVPTTGVYTIEADGAAGGSETYSTNYAGGGGCKNTR